MLKYDGTNWVNGTAVGGTTSPLTTKGDVYTFDTAEARLPVGANGQVLVADSASAVGIKWANQTTTTSTAAFDGGNASTSFTGVGTINLGGAT